MVDSLKVLDPERPIREADIQGNVPCTGSCTGARWALLPSTTRADNPRDFFAASFQPRARLGQNRFYAGCVAPQVMRGVRKMCTIQIARRTAIIRQIQISKTAPMNPAIR